MSTAVSVSDLRKAYGEVEAVFDPIPVDADPQRLAFPRPGLGGSACCIIGSSELFFPATARLNILDDITVKTETCPEQERISIAQPQVDCPDDGIANWSDDRI